MNKIPFAHKHLRTDLNSSDNKYDFYFEKPVFCPHCSISTDAVRVWYNEVSDPSYLVVTYRCTSCNKRFVVTYETDYKSKRAIFADIFPSMTVKYYDKHIADCSPRFIEIYNQALFCESNGQNNLAAIGYRSALEILIKDFAINELQKPHEEVVQRKLAKAIEVYLSDAALSVSADVVRILGNDATHYEQKYSDTDFAVLKAYMEIFVNAIKVKLMIAHPEISRPNRS